MVPVPGDRLLISRDGNLILPPADYPEEFGPDILFGREIGVPDGRSCWAAEVAPGVEPPEGSVFRDLRGLFFGMDEDVFGTTGRAKQIVGWNATHRFCGRCGGQTEPVPGELAKKCMRCGMLHYPRLSPELIVLVRDGSRIVLARSPGFPAGMYSLLPDFVEPGESIEEAVKRELTQLDAPPARPTPP